MRVLLVFAHPLPESFVAALHARVRERLEAGGHEVRDLDLYAKGFDPVLSAEERRRYHQRGLNRQGLEEQIGQLHWAEGLIFVYPTWWYGLPAILKGWLERVWLPHEAFDLLPEGGLQPRLRQIRLLGGISTYGASWLWTRWVGDPGRRTIMRGLRPLCARRCRTFWLALHDIDRAGAPQREAFLQKVGLRIDRLD
jgi:putative NADPH-quinone reductase